MAAGKTAQAVEVNEQQPIEAETEQAFNPLLFTHNMTEAARVWQEVLKILAQEDAFSDIRSGDIGMIHMASDYCQWMTRLMQDPTRLAQLGYVWLSDSANLWQRTMERFMESGADTSEAAEAESRLRDRRFASEAWQNNIFFDYIKEHYLMTSSWMQDAVQRLDDELDDHTQNKLNFYTKQWIDAMAPSNFLITNPEVLHAALESNGETVLKGLQNLREDVERGKGRLAISTSDHKAFQVGENLAATPGQVIYQNELMQLIQYQPKTEQVHATPLLLVPAWINKFYIFDMQQKNSYVRWLLEQGYTVFLISWVNPDERHRDYSFEQYMERGLLEAVDVVREITGQHAVDCMGYCLGGTLLATTLAYLHAIGEQEKIATASYLTTMIDFSEPGELGVFIDEEQIQAIEAKMEKRGYLEGSDMAATFSMLRSNNLIWSFVVNNYLLGKEPFPFDFLYWNSDPTRMPAAMHSFYLRNMYQQNKLKDPGGLSLKGQPIDLSKITTPSFILATREDHIAPWQSAFAATQIYSGDIRFVLAGSGHVAGVINPPAKNKYGFWAEGSPRGKSPDMWLKCAKQHDGSWWGYWDEWRQGYYQGEAMVAAREPGHASYPPLEAAPGSYVKVR